MLLFPVIYKWYCSICINVHKRRRTSQYIAVLIFEYSPNAKYQSFII